jgi:hypothetical protein
MLVAAAGEASVDVELVAFRVLHPHRVVVEAIGAQGCGAGGSDIVKQLGVLAVDDEPESGQASRCRREVCC